MFVTTGELEPHFAACFGFYTQIEFLFFTETEAKTAQTSKREKRLCFRLQQQHFMRFAAG